MSNEFSALTNGFRLPGAGPLVTRYSLLVAAISLLAVIGISGCSKKQPEPPTIVADRSACSLCKMLISDTRFSGACNTGEDKLYDDIGCMLGAITAMSAQPTSLWVRDYETNVWLDAHTAIFVHSPKLATPMNYGFVAVRDAQRAAVIAGQTEGRVLGDWNAAVSFFKDNVTL